MTTPAFGTSSRNPLAENVRTLIRTLRTAPETPHPEIAPDFERHATQDRTSGPDSSDVLTETAPDALVLDALPERALVDDRLGAALLNPREIDAIKRALRLAGLPSFDRLS